MNNSPLYKIFIVDDDAFWVAILEQMLSDLGYTDIATFSNGNDCINNLASKPDLIFLDYQMDDINGIEVLKEIRNSNPNTQVIFCTAIEDIELPLMPLNLDLLIIY